MTEVYIQVEIVKSLVYSLIQFGLESKPPEYKAKSPMSQTILPTLKYSR